jgi:hypothetical protein
MVFQESMETRHRRRRRTTTKAIHNKPRKKIIRCLNFEENNEVIMPLRRK